MNDTNKEREQLTITIEKEDEAKFMDAFMYVDNLDLPTNYKVDYFMAYLKGLINGHEVYGKETEMHSLIVDTNQLILDALKAEIDVDMIWRDIKNNIAEYYITKG